MELCSRHASIVFLTAILSGLLVFLTWYLSSLTMAVIGIAALLFIGYTYREYVA